MAMMYSMTGLSTGIQAPRQTNKTLDIGSQVSEKGKADESKNSQNESLFPEFQKMSGKDRAESELSGAGRRHVGEELQTLDDGEPGGGQGDKSCNLSSFPKTLDTSRQIQYKFQSLNSFAPRTSPSPEETAGMKRRQHISSLKKWVDTEYKQYVKSTEMPYKKGDLRAIMGALDSNDRPQAGSFTSLGSGGSSGKAEAQPNTNYNILNLTKVAKVMSFMDDPVPAVQSETQYL
jgi:hypothetical protein